MKRNKMFYIFALILGISNVAHAILPAPVISVQLTSTIPGQPLTGSTATSYFAAENDGTTSATITLGSDPSISMLGTNNGVWPSDGSGNVGGNGNASIYYYMEFCITTCGLANSIVTNENILVGVNGNILVSDPAAGNAQATLTIVGTGTFINMGAYTNSNPYSSSNDLVPTVFSFSSDTLYEIALGANVNVQPLNSPTATPINDSISVNIDPTFSFAPGTNVPGGYFIFSQGISSVPLPPALSLFVSGLLLLMLLLFNFIDEFKYC